MSKNEIVEDEVDRSSEFSLRLSKAKSKVKHYEVLEINMTLILIVTIH